MPNITKDVSSNPTHDEVYSIQHYVIKSVLESVWSGIWSYVIFVLEIMSSVTVISSRVCMVWYMVICDSAKDIAHFVYNRLIFKEQRLPREYQTIQTLELITDTEDIISNTNITYDHIPDHTDSRLLTYGHISNITDIWSYL
jgi:hypothetical protein